MNRADCYWKQKANIECPHNVAKHTEAQGNIAACARTHCCHYTTVIVGGKSMISFFSGHGIWDRFANRTHSNSNECVLAPRSWHIGVA